MVVELPDAILLGCHDCSFRRNVNAFGFQSSRNEVKYVINA